MRGGPLILLLACLVIAAGIVPVAVAGEEQGYGKGDLIGDAAVTPALRDPGIAALPQLLSVKWWKNGVSQGKIPFISNSATITVTGNDFVMFRVKGTGSGYLLFYDPDHAYGESWLLKPGVKTTKMVGRVYKWASDTDITFEAHPPGSDWSGTCDYGEVHVHVVP